ncbi:hypothetical protein PUR21_16535 [Methylorubrum rhodesianum]|uniref:Uncharacterized protein n=1 Tax=Methylorubrum rhodesianum TaxID=29427 RepID=A0ABU9ZEG6_9HYPH
MIAFLESLSPLQALAVSAIVPGLGVLAFAFLVHEAVGFVRLALTGRL